jgi:hypothetical protein
MRTRNRTSPPFSLFLANFFTVEIVYVSSMIDRGSSFGQNTHNVGMNYRRQVPYFNHGTDHAPT